MNRIKILLAVNVCYAIGFGIYSYLQSEPAVNGAGLAASLRKTTAAVKEDSETKENTQVPPVVLQDNTSTDTANGKQAAMPAFTPPFPDRINIFQPPRRQGRAIVRTGDQTELSVELLGFVNVNGPRVALAIDGMAMTIAEGESRAGVEVLSIQPPAVVLKRGRQRWQASFEN